MMTAQSARWFGLTCEGGVFNIGLACRRRQGWTPGLRFCSREQSDKFGQN